MKDFLKEHGHELEYKGNKEYDHYSGYTYPKSEFRKTEEYDHYSSHNYRVHREFKNFNPPMDTSGHWETSFYGRHEAVYL